MDFCPVHSYICYLHFLELQKYEKWKNKHQKRHRLLDYWVRFFGANEFQENELEEFREEPIMGKALETLEEFSQEPSARQLTEMESPNQSTHYFI